MLSNGTFPFSLVSSSLKKELHSLLIVVLSLIYKHKLQYNNYTNSERCQTERSTLHKFFSDSFFENQKERNTTEKKGMLMCKQNTCMHRYRKRKSFSKGLYLLIQDSEVYLIQPWYTGYELSLFIAYKAINE